jgi:hypothetical protein
MGLFILNSIIICKGKKSYKSRKGAVYAKKLALRGAADDIYSLSYRLHSCLQSVLAENTSDGQELEAEKNYGKLASFVEVESVKRSYDEAHIEASQIASSSIPCSWTMSGQSPPYQSPRDMTVDQLYAQAERAKKPYFHLLQALEVLVNAEQRQKAALELKGKDRAADKIERDYGGDASRLIDIVRGSIICRGFDEMNTIIAFLQKPETRRNYNEAYIVRIKSGFAEQYAVKTYGYRDVKVRNNLIL